MMYWPIPNTRYPTWAIDLTQLNDFLEITEIIKALGILKYNYSFIFKQEVIKHGISADHSRTWGERIYRQAGHLEGWNRKLAPDSSGCDMRSISDSYQAINGQPLNRMGMLIVVVDMTHVPSPDINDPAYPCKKLERESIKKHVEMYGKLPIGNVKSEEYIDRKAYVSRDTWSNLFEDN